MRSLVGLLSLGTSPLIVARTSHIPSVSHDSAAFESHEAANKISAYTDQRRAVHLRQLILTFLFHWRSLAWAQGLSKSKGQPSVRFGGLKQVSAGRIV